MDIIDSFVVTLGLDPRNYHSESKKFREDLKRSREESRRTARDLQDDAKRSAQYFSSLKNEVIGLVLAIAGARSMGGLIADMVTGAAATGRLALNLGMATEQVSAWEGAVRSMGGTAADAQSALALLNNEFQQRRLTGQLPHAAELAALGIPLNQMTDPNTLLMSLAERSQHMDRQQFVARMQGIGLPDSVINTLVRGRRAVQDLLDEQRRLGVVTDRDARAAIEFERVWANLTTQLRGDLRPALTWLLETGLPFVREHMGEVAAGAAGLGIAIAAMTFEIWAIPAAVAAAGAALVWLNDRFHALDAWRDFFLHVQSLRLEGQLLGIPNDTREHLAQRLALQQQIADIADQRYRLEQNAAGVVPPMPGVTIGPWGPLAPTTGGGTSGPFSAVAPRIRATEGGRAGYDAIVYGIHGPRPTSMSLGDVFRYQIGALRAQTRGHPTRSDPRGIGSTGMGAYQFESQTLRSMAIALFGASWATQPFSAANQDRMAQELYRREGLRPWAIGHGSARVGGARMALQAGSGGGGVHVGQIVVYTPHGTTGAQAEAVARAIPDAVRRRNLVTQANGGLR